MPSTDNRAQQNVAALLLEQRQRQGTAVACSIAGERWTYEAFYTLVDAIVSQLPTSARRIGVASTNSPHTYAAIVAIWLSGRTYIPLPEGPDDSIDAWVTEGEVHALRADSNWSTSGTAYVLRTSGTTGSPKHIPISYTNLEAFIDSFLQLDLSLCPSDRFLQMAPLSFDMSIIAFLIPLCVGASFHTPEDRTHPSFAALRCLEEEHLTVAVCAPSTLELVKNYLAEVSLPDLRLTLFGAEELDRALCMDWLKVSPTQQIWNLYGPSEGGIFATAHRFNPENDLNRHVPIGRPCKNIQTLLRSAGDDLYNLLISGKQVFDGYESSDRLEFIYIGETQWYDTGDLVSKTSNGELMFAGRRDDQIKYFGKRINLGIIRDQATRFAKVNMPSLRPEMHYIQNKEVQILVPSRATLAELQSHLDGHLPSGYPPVRVVVTDGQASTNYRADEQKTFES